MHESVRREASQLVGEEATPQPPVQVQQGTPRRGTAARRWCATSTLPAHLFQNLARKQGPSEGVLFLPHLPIFVYHDDGFAAQVLVLLEGFVDLSVTEHVHDYRDITQHDTQHITQHIT